MACLAGDRTKHQVLFTMKNQPKMALIVARPGPLRNSLFSLMCTLPQIDLVAESRDMSSLLRIGSQIQPDLIVMETGLPGGHINQAVRHIKAEWAASRTVVLVDDVAQQQEAKLAGADVVLFKGFRAANLMELVENLLSREKTPNQNVQEGYRQPSPLVEV
jgi:DNA-binding NarL/FixJ family response regulator